MREIKLASGFIEMNVGDKVVGKVRLGDFTQQDGTTRKRGIIEASAASGGDVAWLPDHVGLTRKLQQVPPNAVVMIESLGTSTKAFKGRGKKKVYDYRVGILDTLEIAQLRESKDASMNVKRLLAAPKNAAGDDEGVIDTTAEALEDASF